MHASKEDTDILAKDEQQSGHHRRAAGEDPVKREQILDGAKRVFMKLGFSAASMNDVTREAGVSKGTIYVYFKNKEDLFGSLIERERTRIAESMRLALAEEVNVEDALAAYGRTFAYHFTSADIIRAMRSVIGVVDTMPELPQRLFACAPQNARTVLMDYFEHQVRDGKLAIDDIELASWQFMDLTTGSLFKLRIFGEFSEKDARERIDKVVDGAVRVFMAAYGPKAR